MSQPITIGSTLGMIQIPWFEKDADALKAAPAYNATGLTVQLVIGETFYSYTSASPASIVEYVAGTKETPADNTEIVWRVPDASSNVALVYVHSSLYDTLNVSDGQSIGHITASADTYGAVASVLGFSKGISVDSSGMVGVSELANNTITPASILDGAITVSKIADGALSAAKFASGAFDAVWSVTTRALTTFGFTVTTDAASRDASKADVSDIPKVGKTTRHRNIDSGETEDVELQDPPA